MRKRALILLLAGIVGAPTLAATYYLTLDVPAELTAAGMTFPGSIVLHDTTMTGYTPQLGLPAGTAIAGLHIMNSGEWLLSVETPTQLGGTTWFPQDVLRYNQASGTFTCFFSGAAAGLPISAGVDVVFLPLGDSGPLVLSFKTPTIIGGTTYFPSDLVQFSPTGAACTGWTFSGVYFDASAASPPIPPNANLTSAARLGANIIMSFDVPMTLGSTTYFPGDLVSYAPLTKTFSLFYRDATWPVRARVNGLTFPTAGSIPDSTPLTVTFNRTSGNLTLSWGPSCPQAAYNVYEGTLGARFAYNHTAKFCLVPGTIGIGGTVTFSAPPGNTYYLVAPSNSLVEGSYGHASNNTEIPAAALSCRPQQIATACP